MLLLRLQQTFANQYETGIGVACPYRCFTSLTYLITLSMRNPRRFGIIYMPKFIIFKHLGCIILLGLVNRNCDIV